MVTDYWLNDVQEELLSVLIAAGVSPVKGTQNQVLTAMMALATGQGGMANNDYIKIPFRDKTSGVRRELIIQWIRSTTLGGQAATSNFPIAFPNACCGVRGASVNGSSPQTISVGSVSNTGFAAWGGTVPSGFGAIAIGY